MQDEIIARSPVFRPDGGVRVMIAETDHDIAKLLVNEYMSGWASYSTRLHTRGEGSSQPVAINKNPDGSDNFMCRWT